MQDGQLVLHQVGALADLGERETELTVFGIVPARPDPDLDPAAAHLVDGGHDLGERPRMAERDRRDQRSDSDRGRFAGDARQHGPGVCRRFVGRARKASVVVGPKEGVEAEALGKARQVELFGVGEPLLRLGHQRETHRHPPPHFHRPRLRPSV